MHGKTENVVFIYIHVYTCVDTEVGEKHPTYLCCSIVDIIWFKVLKIPYNFN